MHGSFTCIYPSMSAMKEGTCNIITFSVGNKLALGSAVEKDDMKLFLPFPFPLLAIKAGAFNGHI